MSREEGYMQGLHVGCGAELPGSAQIPPVPLPFLFKSLLCVNSEAVFAACCDTRPDMSLALFLLLFGQLVMGSL